MMLRKQIIDGEALWSLGSRLLPADWKLAGLLGQPAREVSAYLADTVTEETLSGREARLLAPLDDCHEVWASGVTYIRSREARTVESQGADFYDRVYDAIRPELFYKAVGWRVRGPENPVCIRPDSHWNVPEPELVLVLNHAMDVIGFTIGNDVSSRSIEGENPLYLPQAKVFDGGCAIGPGILLASNPTQTEFTIEMRISRRGVNAFEGRTSTGEMKRTFLELGQWLGKHLSFPHGALLMTGTGLVPDDDFTLIEGDRVEIFVPEIGTLRNRVVAGP